MRKVLDVRVFLAGLAVLIGLSLSVMSVRAQSNDTAPSNDQKPNTSDAQNPPASDAQKPPANDTAAASSARKAQDAKQFAKAMEMVRKEGRYTLLTPYVSQTLGFSGISNDYTQQVNAHALENTDTETGRVFYVIEQTNTNAAVLMTKVDNQVTVYVTNGSGTLTKAFESSKQGFLKNEMLYRIPLARAIEGFQKEKDFWLRQFGLDQQADASAAH